MVVIRHIRLRRSILNHSHPAPPIRRSALRPWAAAPPAQHRPPAARSARARPTSTRFADGYQQDPPDYVRWAREQEPVFYSPELGYWVVTRYDEHQGHLPRQHHLQPVDRAGENHARPATRPTRCWPPTATRMSRTLVNEDEPAHMPRRRVLMEPFTPEELKHHEPMVRKLAREYVDRFIDDGKADLVDQMLWEVPLTVALHFLGVPEEDMDTLREYSIAHTVNTWGRPKPESRWRWRMRSATSGSSPARCSTRCGATRRGRAGCNTASASRPSYPEVVTDSYLHSMMMAGIVAAHETTANATANAMKLLLQHPHVWREICDDPGLIPNAVEECLRHNGSVAAWRRLATRDVTHRRRRHPGRRQAADRHLVGQPRRAPFLGRRPVRHPARQRQRPPDLRLRLAPVHGQEPGAHGDADLPGGIHAPPAAHDSCAEQTFSAMCRIPRFAGPSTCWVEWDPAQQSRSARTRPCSTCGAAGAHRRAVAPRHHAGRCVVEQRDAASPTASSGCAWSRPMARRCRAGRRARTSMSSAAAPGCRASTRCAATRPMHPALEIAVLREPESRGGSAWIHANVKRRRPAQDPRAAQPFPDGRIGIEG